MIVYITKCTVAIYETITCIESRRNHNLRLRTACDMHDVYLAYYTHTILIHLEYCEQIKWDVTMR